MRAGQFLDSAVRNAAKAFHPEITEAVTEDTEDVPWFFSALSVSLSVPSVVNPCWIAACGRAV